MEKVKVLGVKKVNFVNEDTGEAIIGSQLWLGAETPEETWNGNEVFKIWVPDGHGLKGAVDALEPYQDIEIQLDRKGKKLMQLNVLS